ncbi:kinesin-like protein [Vairimorpha necatrix]|uniref:Kinesin-like protein n=1 Tax=Vairimorpha necatrix TaxID=6039 RepID=A0AAX4JDW1_9MICR
MSDKIEVHIRINPMKTNRVWKHTQNRLIRLYEDKEILYDNFINILYKENNYEVYKKCIKQKIKSDSNCTIFAYGQTGSGKTYTMLGDKSNGMILLSLQDLLLDYLLQVSYIEIYNEKIFDLSTGKELKIYNVNNKTVINDLTLTNIKDMKDAKEFIDKCEVNRRYGSTEYNNRSSRSHTIFQIKYKKDDIEIIINLIDLAGSEKASLNVNRRAEGAFINKSLLALCTVVNNLKNNKYLGFRDSKLTRLLQNSLDGNTNIVALCAISPSDDCIEETISTLNFGARLSNLDLKKIVTKQEIKIPEEIKIADKIEDNDSNDVEKPEVKDLKEKIKANSNNIEKNEKQKMKQKQDINIEKQEMKHQPKISERMNMEEMKEFIIKKQEIKENFIVEDVKPFKELENKKIKLYEDRIETLEKMIINMFKKCPNKNMKDIFILEKHMFNLKLKKIEK